MAASVKVSLCKKGVDHSYLPSRAKRQHWRMSQVIFAHVIHAVTFYARALFIIFVNDNSMSARGLYANFAKIDVVMKRRFASCTQKLIQINKG
ncbi:hypothetical protein ACMGGS_16520 [Superficieibacter sp. BNK-5]|uniref:hypothetical protein n=1 Tax=Superficieibacter sp. BNK-5 TaxID=3376142 RepID=UPI0039BFE019